MQITELWSHWQALLAPFAEAFTTYPSPSGSARITRSIVGRLRPMTLAMVAIFAPSARSKRPANHVAF
jgi:hypothetical protein